MITLVLHLLRLLPFLWGGHRRLAIENFALRQQLAVYKRTVPRPRLRTTDRLFWVGLARVWTVTYAAPSLATLRTTPRRALTFRSTRMHRTADQLSGPNAAGSSRFAKSVACTIATSTGRPDLAQSIRHRRRRPPASFELHLVPWWVLMVPDGWLPCLQSVARSLLSSLVCRESSEVGLASGIRFWRRTAPRASALPPSI